MMGSINVIKFDFFFRRRSWAEVTAAGFEGNGQGGKYLAGQWFLHRSPWPFLCLSQHSSGRVWRRRNICIMGICVPARAGTWDSGSTAEGAMWGCFCRDSFQQIVAGPACALSNFETWIQKCSGATNTTLLSASTQYRLFFQNISLGGKKILLESPYICIQR